MEVINGYIDHIIYQKPTNSYTVLSLITEDQEELICVGTFPGIDEGQNLSITGEFVEHPTYGHQLKASSFEVVMPRDRVSMERYLGSGAIKGVGEALARRIIKTFGDDTFTIIEREPERLAEIKGISLRKAQEIAIQFMDKQKMRDAFIFLQGYGVSNNLSVKIYEKYGDGMYTVLQNNPYQLAEDISGVGFKIADEIARKIGISVSSEFRIRSGVLYVLQEGAVDGNVFLPREMLIARTSALLELDASAIEDELSNLAVDKKIVIKGERIYSYHYYYAELNCAKMLDELNIEMDEEDWQREEAQISKEVQGIIKEQNIELHELQHNAVMDAIRYGVTVISGGPGTGKTTTINTIIGFFRNRNLDIMLAAPTGRAAKRMQEATGCEASTIHRMLEVQGGTSEDERGGFFERNQDNPLETDVVIVDEMSMVDINLFRALLRAISIGTRLIMVGDVDQLPSVGPGQILKDIIDSQAFKVTCLEHIFRQAEESDIVVNAHKINKGLRISLDNKSKDFFFLKRDDATIIQRGMITLIKDKLPKYVDAGPLDIQVLTPMRKGPLGVEGLNEILQKYLNPEQPGKKEHHSGERLFRVGDKVMQTKNNYQLPWRVRGYNNITIDEGQGVFNGDMGVVKDINPMAQTLTVIFDENKEVDYPMNSLDELELSYAITIHKSQGSEYPAVIMPLLGGPRMLFSRNLLYTGVTRAKKCVTILGSEDCINDMIDNEFVNERYTSLCERIKEVTHIE